MTPSAIAKVAVKTNKESNNQKALDFVVHTMKLDINRVWTSTELYEIYVENSGDSDVIGKRKLVDYLSEVLGNTLIVLKSPGLASILIFC